MMFYDEPTRYIPAGARSRSISARADEMMRVAPRGVRTALIEVADGHQQIDDLPQWALDWLTRHDAIRPAERSDHDWARTKLLNALLKRIEGRYQ